MLLVFAPSASSQNTSRIHFLPMSVGKWGGEAESTIRHLPGSAAGETVQSQQHTASGPLERWRSHSITWSSLPWIFRQHPLRFYTSIH